MMRFFVGSAGFALLGLRITMLLILCILERLAAIRLRNDFLIELLAIGKAESPTLERLLERAKAAE